MATFKPPRDWRIQTKIIAGFLLVAAVAGTIGYVGVSGLQRIQKADQALYQDATLPVTYISAMRSAFERTTTSLRDIIMTDSEEENERLRLSMIADTEEINRLTAALDSVNLSPAMRAELERYAAARTAFLPYRSRIIELGAANQNQEAYELLTGEARTDIDAVDSSLADLEDMIIQEASSQATANEETARTAVRIMLFVLAGGVVLALLLGTFISRLIATPVRALETAAQRMADGDYSVRFTATSNDEIGSLARAFQLLMDMIAKSWSEVQEEKASVEQKVEDAVRQSEAQRAYLNGSVERLLVAMQQFADGDLTVAVRAERDDEIGQLFEGFNRAVANLRDMLLQVGQSVATTASAATQISAATDGLSVSMQEQSAQSNEVAAAVEQMVATIVETSRNTTQTSDAAKASGQVAREGGLAVSDTVDKMRRIAHVVQDSTATVERLGEASRRIGDIVSVIDEIASQTNLLALNATIEAARAGEQGRGFAVVADEVRKLAERTGSATKEIAQMISEIQQGTAAAVQSMQTGDAEVREGMVMADRAGQALGQTVAGAENTLNMVGQIAAAMEEQSVTSEQISRSVEAISSVSQDSARDVTQIAESADELSRLTENLRTLISQFRVGEEARRTAERSAWGDGSTRADLSLSPSRG